MREIQVRFRTIEDSFSLVKTGLRAPKGDAASELLLGVQGILNSGNQVFFTFIKVFPYVRFTTRVRPHFP